MLKQCLVWIKNGLIMGRQDYHWKHEPILYGWKPGASHRWYGGRKQSTVFDSEQGIAIRESDDGTIITFDDGVRSIGIKTKNYEIASSGNDTSAWRFNKPLRNTEHPTMKPVALCERAIKNSSKKGDVVLDCFAGSGSTLIAAERTGRRCFAMELDPVYCDVIIRRWEDLAGGKAEPVL